MSIRTAGRRPQRRSNQEPVGSTLLKGGAVMAIVAALVAFAVTVQKGVPGKDYSTMYVAADHSGSLRGQDKVAIGGVRVGRVVSVTPGGDGARIKLQLEPGVTLPADTTVRIRANGLLGARYVQLIPGKAATDLADGATIRGGKDVLSSTVPDALDVFDAETRGALGASLTGLGRGVLGNGAGLNDAVRVASDATVPFARVLRDVEQQGRPERLVQSLNTMAGTLDASRQDLARLFAPAAAALRPLGDGRDDLRATVDVAPSALAAATGGLGQGQRLLAATAELARSANRTLPSAPTGLGQAAALLREASAPVAGGSPLQRASSLLRAVGPAVPAALKVTGALRPVLPQLEDSLGSLAPILQYVGRYGCDFINTGVVLRSMTGFVGTGTGPNGPSSQFRLQAAAGVEATGLKEQAADRDAYYAPCTYTGHAYKVTPGTGIGGR